MYRSDGLAHSVLERGDEGDGADEETLLMPRITVIASNATNTDMTNVTVNAASPLYAVVIRTRKNTIAKTVAIDKTMITKLLILRPSGPWFPDLPPVSVTI